MSKPESEGSTPPAEGHVPAVADHEYERKIYSYSAEVREPHFLEFRHLQRINLTELQNSLARQKALFAKSESVTAAQLTTLQHTLHSYANAIRDYEYILSLAEMTGSERDDRYKDLLSTFPDIGLAPSQPFNSFYRTFRPHSSFQSDPLRDFLKWFLPRRLTWTSAEKSRHVGEFIDYMTPEEVSPIVDGIARLVISVVAGAALIAPVVVMEVGKRSVRKNLITMSVAIGVFAIALAFGAKTSNTETLIATATYAAVVAVFVGTSGP